MKHNFSPDAVRIARTYLQLNFPAMYDEAEPLINKFVLGPLSESDAEGASAACALTLNIFIAVLYGIEQGAAMSLRAMFPADKGFL